MKNKNFRKLIRNLRKKENEKLSIRRVTSFVSEGEEGKANSISPRDNNFNGRE